MKRIILLAALLFAVAACGTSTITRTVTPQTTYGSGDDAAHATIYHCGIERWTVKTGTDSAAAQVNLNDVQQTTIANLVQLAVPSSFSQDAPRLPPVEMTVYQIHATLTGYKMEGDSDYHLVLSDGTNTMIAEIPLPGCVGQTSPFLPGIAAARAAFDAKYAPVGGLFTHVSVPVTVTGVGFFDTIHGQTGVAPNGIELHAVLGIQFSGSPSASASP